MTAQECARVCMCVQQTRVDLLCKLIVTRMFDVSPDSPWTVERSCHVT